MHNSMTEEQAQSIQAGLVDYFRYVAGHVAYEHSGKAIARQTVVLETMKNTLADFVSCSKRMAEMAEELDELRALANCQSDLLSRTAIALRGPEPELTRWSHHDLPELASQLKMRTAKTDG